MNASGKTVETVFAGHGKSLKKKDAEHILN